jgi:hypothetical protein
MAKLTLIRGDERARKFLEEGASIADFLTDPLRPCVVRAGLGGIIALNRGSINSSFFSTFWSQGISATADAYVVEYMADEAVVLQMPPSYVRAPNDVDKFLAQRGACELDYKGDASDIRRKLVTKGFAVQDLASNPLKCGELEAQREANIEKMAAELAEFYGE